MAQENALLYQQMSFQCWLIQVVMIHMLMHQLIVDWQNSEYCPSQDSGPIFESVGPVFIPYYDFCGSYTITAASLAPYPVKLCSVRSDEYPIPNWTISRNEDNCTLEKSTIAEFMN